MAEGTMSASGGDGLVYVPTSVLKPADWNPRIILTAEFRQLCTMIRQDPGFLLARPVLAMDDGTIYAGAQRYRAVCQLYREGWESPLWATGHIPCILHDITLEQAKARGIRDNNHAGHWQEIELAEILNDLAEKVSADVLPTLGFNDVELNNIMAAAGLTDPVDPLTRRTIQEPRDVHQEPLQGTDGPSRPEGQEERGAPLTIVLMFENEVQLDQAQWWMASRFVRQELSWPEVHVYNDQGVLIHRHDRSDRGS